MLLIYVLLILYIVIYVCKTYIKLYKEKKLHVKMRLSFLINSLFKNIFHKFLNSHLSKFEAIFDFFSFLFSRKLWWLGLLLENDDEKIFPVHGFSFYFMCITVQGSQTSFYKTNLAWRDLDINIYISNFVIWRISLLYIYYLYLSVDEQTNHRNY